MRKLVVFAALLACSRQLDVPQGKPLAFDPSTLTAAPRESLTLAATGGQPPYRFQFAPAGQGSGADAAVDVATGKYQAGSVGPAIDQLEAVDSNGARASVRVSVGPTLVAFPPAANVAPGGIVAFVVTGGKPPYALTAAADAAGHIAGTSFVAPVSAGCAAAPFPGATVALTLTDAAGVKLPLTVSVSAGLDLRPAAGTAEVAPSETLALIASGGQAPFVSYKVVAAGSGAARIGADGTYAAGLTGDAVDTVSVTDSNGQERCLDLHVGPALGAALSTSDVRPGTSLQVLASGGRAPYSFAFAFKGNRSFGSIDPVTGTYVAGPNPNTTDRLLVRDATGAPPVEVQAPLGARTLVLTNASTLHLADIDGDGRADIIASDLSSTWVALSGLGAMQVHSYAALGGVVTPFDLDGNRRADLVSSLGQILLAQPGGLLQQGPVLPAGFGTSNAPFLVYSLPSGAPGTRIMGRYTDAANACGGGLFHNWVAHVNVPQGGSTPGALVCDLEPASAPGLFASGDWNGDGIPDVAFSSGALLYLMTGKSDGSYNAPAQVPTLAPLPFISTNSGDQRGHPGLRAIRPQASNADDLLALVADNPFSPTTSALAVIRPASTSEAHVSVGGLAMSNFSVFTPRPGAAPMVLAMNGLTGDIAVLPYPFTADPAPALAGAVAPRDILVEEAKLGDLDGDGIADLVIGNHLITRLEVLTGDGTGTFGKRLHFANLGSSTRAIGDVDGDGLHDVVFADSQQNVRTLFASQHQLATSGPTQMPEPSHDLALLDLDGDGVPDLLYASDAGHLFFARGRRPADGVFGAPQAVQVSWPGGGGATLPPLYSPLRTSVGAQPALFVDVGRRFPKEGVLVFSDPTHAALYVAAQANLILPNSPLNPGCVADIDGDGVPDVLIPDVDASSNAAVSYSLVKPGDPPSATWPFRPWVTVTLPGFIDTPQTLGPVGGRGCAFVDDSQIAFAYVDATGAHVNLIRPDLGTIGWTFGDVTGDGKADFVSQDDAGIVHIFPGDGAGGVGAESASLVGIGNLNGVLARPDGFGDLLFSTAQDFVVVPNDGAGGFQQ